MRYEFQGYFEPERELTQEELAELRKVLLAMISIPSQLNFSTDYRLFIEPTTET